MKKSFENFSTFAISGEKRKAIKGGRYIQCSLTLAYPGGDVVISGSCASSSFNECIDYINNLADWYASIGENVYAPGCSQY